MVEQIYSQERGSLGDSSRNEHRNRLLNNKITCGLAKPTVNVYLCRDNKKNDNMTIDRSSRKEHDDTISLMENFLSPEQPKLGIFWYDYRKEQLFGVEKREISEDDMKGIHTLEKLHRTFWQKWHHRAVAKNDISSIYYQQHNYTLIPRGRIFVIDGEISVRVGEWITEGINGVKINLEKFHDLICDEFDLPEDVRFVIDEHWNLGHGWSERDNLIDRKAKSLDMLAPDISARESRGQTETEAAPQKRKNGRKL